jgi:catechol 2,3-dioxygenase
MAIEYGIAPPAYRLPDSTHVGRVRLQVASLHRSITYYQDVIGLHVLQRNDGSAVIGARGDTAGLIELREREGARPLRQHSRLGLYHFAILVPDRTALGRFVAHLAKMKMRVASADHLVSEAIYLWDPDGLGIEVYADRPREAWQIKGRELMMSTEALDLEALARVGSNDSWDGLPLRTTIGHVHLHVGSLERASVLYHAGLGLDKVVWSYPGALFMSAGGYHHHLGMNTWAEGAPPPDDDDARLLEWELALPAQKDVIDAAASVVAAGFAIRPERDDRVVSDDWGTTLRLTARP